MARLEVFIRRNNILELIPSTDAGVAAQVGMGRGTTIGGATSQATRNPTNNDRATAGTTIGGSSLGSFSNPFRSGGVVIGGESNTGVFTNYDHLEKKQNIETEDSFQQNTTEETNNKSNDGKDPFNFDEIDILGSQMEGNPNPFKESVKAKTTNNNYDDYEI